MHLLIIVGSDAGIIAALRARELDPSVDTTVVVADAFPNFSICGLPFYLSGEVGDYHNLAHRTAADIEREGIRLLLDHTAQGVLSAPPPYDDPPESLLREGVQDSQHHRFVKLLRQVDVSAAVIAVFGCGTKGHSREHKRFQPVLFAGPRRRGCAYHLRKPGVEIHRQMGALLLCAAGRNDGQPALSRPLAKRAESPHSGRTTPG